MSLATVKLVIFDCDGVLFRSEAANIGFYNEVLRRVGEPPLDDHGEVAAHALASAQLFEKYYGDRPRTLSRIREVASTIDYAPFYPLMEPREHLRDVLAALRSDYRLAMATNRGKTVHGVLEYFDLGEYFDLAVGVLDVDRPKPHPDMLIRCAEHFGVTTAESVYVGDQPTDLAAARSAGMPFVGIGSVAADADRSIGCLSEIPRLLCGEPRPAGARS